MIKKKEFYNPELETTDVYTEIWQPELMEVRDISDLLVVNHYWQDAEGELWGDFNDPMENVRNVSKRVCEYSWNWIVNINADRE